MRLLTSNQLDEYVAYIKEFSHNMLRAIRIRVKLTHKRIKALRTLIKRNRDPDALEVLRTCCARENRLIGIIENSLQQTRQMLHEAYEEMEAGAPSNPVTKQAKKAIDLLAFYDDNLVQIGKRKRLEEAYLRSKSKEDFKAFLHQFKEELKFERALLKKTVDADALDNYMKKACYAYLLAKKNRGKRIKRLLAPYMGSDAVKESLKFGSTKEKAWIAVYGGAILLLGEIAALVKNFVIAEYDVYHVNADLLNEMINKIDEHFSSQSKTQFRLVT